MPQRALTLRDIATELGRSPNWVRLNWRNLVKNEGLPPPLLDSGRGADCSWSAAQFYAWQDQKLSKAMRATVAAYRAAFEAASAPDGKLLDTTIADATERLSHRYVKGGEAA
jgi:hypothetical protein